MTTLPALFAFVAATAFTACGSSTTTTDANGKATSSEPSLPAPAEDAGSDTSADAGAAQPTLEAPTLTEAMPMGGGLHVFWKNPAKTTCDTIEGERKSDGESYAVVFSVPGEATNKHDSSKMKAGTTYTYRLRCKVGSAYSPYSNELSAATQP